MEIPVSSTILVACAIMLLFAQAQGEYFYGYFKGSYKKSLQNPEIYFKFDCYQYSESLSFFGVLTLVDRRIPLTKQLLAMEFFVQSCENILKGGTFFRITKDDKEKNSYRIGYRYGTKEFSVFRVSSKGGIEFVSKETSINIGGPEDDNWVKLHEFTLYDFKNQDQAETLRFILSYMKGDAWEDVRVDPNSEQWATLKDSMPLGKLPVLVVDGERFVFSMATTRYLATLAGLAGSNPYETLQIDTIADTLQYLLQQMNAFQAERDEGKKKALKNTFVNEILPSFFERLDKTVGDNYGYLADKPSWVDFQFTTFVDTLNLAIGSADVTAGYNNLQELRQTVLNLPRIKQWVAKRPNSNH